MSDSEQAPSAAGVWERFLASRSLAIPGVVIAVNLLLGIATNRFVLRDFPVSGDENSYLISARLIAEGRLSVPSPVPARFFSSPHVINNGRFYGKYPPGWPLLLAAGVLIGLPWLVNLALGAAILALIYVTARRLFSVGEANLSMALALGNPFLIFNSASYFSHVSCLAALTLFVAAALSCLRTPESRVAPLVAGGSIGLAFLIRPFTTACIGLVTLAYVAWRGIRTQGWRPVGKWMGWAAGPALAFLALNLLYNLHQTGNAFLSPFQLYHPGDAPTLSTALHLGQWKYLVWGRLLDLTWWMPVAPILAVIYGVQRSTRSHADGLLLCALPASLLVGHAFYGGEGGFQYGPRYLFEGSAALLIVSAASIRSFGRMGTLVLAGILVLNAACFAEAARTKSADIRTRREVFDLVEKQRVTNAVVFVRPRPGIPLIDDLVRNGIHFDAPVLYVRDRGTENAELLRRYPGRAAYIYEYDSGARVGRLRPRIGDEPAR